MQRVAEVVARLGVIRSDGQSLLVMQDGLFEAVEQLQGVTEAVVPFGKIRNALSEIFRVSRRYVLLVEIDCRPMRWRKKLEAISLSYGYMHRYEKLVDHTIARLVETETLRDDKGHPRYTVFLFAKS